MLKNPPPNAGDMGDVSSIPGSGRTPGEGNGYTLPSSCLENPMDSGAWRATVHRVSKSWTQLSTYSLSMLLWFQVNGKGTQPYIYLHPFPPKPSPIQAGI